MQTVHDLVHFALRDEYAAGEVLAALGPELSALPEDRQAAPGGHLQSGYRRLDQDLSQSFVEAAYKLAHAAGGQLAAARRLRATVGECATDRDAGNDGPCLAAFVERFGARALRRPLRAGERDAYLALHGSGSGVSPSGLANVITNLLTAPQFLYLVEQGRVEQGSVEQGSVEQARLQVPRAGENRELAPFELASRLSYHFWDTMPDDELWEAARAGALDNAQEYARQVARLFADPRTRQTMREFYRDWLQLEKLPDLRSRNEQPVFRAFAGKDLPLPGLRRSMIEEVLDLADYYTWDQPSGLESLLQTDLSFARTRDLADLYGLRMHVPGVPPPSFVAGKRRGILTRAAFLATGSATTRPIKKGVFIRTNILCDPLPPPPGNVARNAPELSDTHSTRQVVEALTGQPGTQCAGCHRRHINPLGFATENFDALGRWRKAQPLFNTEGVQVGTAPIDTRSVPFVVRGDKTPASGSADLMQLIVKSGKAHSCLVRQYFRFTFGRWENLKRDGCALDQLWRALARGGSLQAMLKQAALTPEFRRL
ncbi:MAG: DUF1592 domain-containing protein [Proteobacteria bacterium]|nr:DUF1592 domain-containing protein [Pseudomonadota bacterium]